MDNSIWFFLQVFFVICSVMSANILGSEAIVACLSVFTVLANILVLKLTVVFGLEVTCADCYAVGSVVCVNLLREFYGKDAAKKGIITGILITIFAALWFIFFKCFYNYVGPY